MKLSRRDAIRISGSTLAGLSMGAVLPKETLAGASQQEPWPDQLVEQELRQRPALPLEPDGSAREYPASQAGTISDPVIWRYTNGEPPDIEFDYRQLAIKVDPRGSARLGGTLKFADLEPLPRHSQVVLLQCGAPNPTGIVKWTGVRFSDFAEMIGVQPAAHYCQLVAADGHWVDEDIKTLMHPQAMLVWLLNDEPLPPKHGAPLRLVIPFRYGARSIKAITEISFGQSPRTRQPPSR